MGEKTVGFKGTFGGWKRDGKEGLTDLKSWCS